MPIQSGIRGAFRGAIFTSGRRNYVSLLEAELLEAELKAEERREDPPR